MLNTIADLLPSTYTHNARIRIWITEPKLWDGARATEHPMRVWMCATACFTCNSTTRSPSWVSERACAHLPNRSSCMLTHQGDPKWREPERERDGKREWETAITKWIQRKRNEKNKQNISFYICELKKQPENSGNKYTFYNSRVVISCQNEDVKKLGDGREVKE